MVFFTSLEFVMGLVLAIGALALVRRARHLLAFEAALFVVNLSFLALMADFDWHAELAMLITALAAYAGALMMRSGRWRSLGFAFAMTVILLVFAVAKYRFMAAAPLFREFSGAYAALFQLRQPLMLVGISYFTFKIIHFLVDVYQGSITQFSLIRYLNFVFFFPAFLSGPIDRYPNFSASTEAAARGQRQEFEWYEILARFARGLLKKQVVANALTLYAVGQLAPEALAGRGRMALVWGAYAYTFFIYFDFSGYSDLAIATGRALGFRVPENFNSPFVSRSIQEYWTRWHISLSEWIRDYLFYPTQRALLDWFPNLPDYTIPAFAIVFAFTICGIWHGGSLHYLLWGMGQGVGLAVYMIYSGEMKKRLKKRYKTLREERWYQVAAIALTVSFVVFDNLLFADNGIEVLKLLFFGKRM